MVSVSLDDLAAAAGVDTVFKSVGSISWGLIMSLRLTALLLSAALSGFTQLQASEADAFADKVAAMGRVGYAASPRYSPDGSEIAFITTLSGKPQLWRMPANGGYPREVTALADPVSRIDWAPDGKSLVYAVSAGGGFSTQIYLTDRDGVQSRRVSSPTDANNFAGAFVDDGRYHYGSNIRDPASIDTWIHDPATGESTLAIKRDGLGGINDLIGDRALVSELVTRGNTNLWIHDLSTAKRTLLTEHEGPASVSGRFGSDPRTVYLSHNLNRDNSVFARINLNADGEVDERRTLAERDDAELDSFLLSKARDRALLIWNVAGRSELELIELDDGQRSPLPAPPSARVVGGEFAPNGRSVALMIGGSAAPWDLWRLDLANGNYQQLSFSPHAGVDMAQMVRPQLREFVAHDGLKLSGWLYLPQQFAAPGPVVLSFHGGPEGQERPAFRADYQALLASGIAVFAPNIRGSSGFGKAFLQLDNHENRFDANRDIGAAAEFLIKAEIGAAGHLGIMGGSYGGYATMVGVTDFPDTFAAGANLYGIVNFETFFAESTPWMGAISVGEYGDPKTQADLLRRLSPIHKLDQVKAAMLVMHGANDTNVPVVEAEQVVDTLKAQGNDVTYVLFADEGHGWRQEPNRIRSTVEIAQFFRRHLTGDADAGSIKEDQFEN